MFNSINENEIDQNGDSEMFMDITDYSSNLKTTVILGGIIITNNIDEIATQYLRDLDYLENSETKLEIDASEKSVRISEELRENSELTSNVSSEHIQDHEDAHNFQDITHFEDLFPKFYYDEVAPIECDVTEKYDDENENIDEEMMTYKKSNQYKTEDTKNNDHKNDKTRYNDNGIDNYEDLIKMNLIVKQPNDNKPDDDLENNDKNDATHKIDDIKLNKSQKVENGKMIDVEKAEMDNISISSESSSGYNSSYFNFITEEEAKFTGFMRYNSGKDLLNENFGDEHFDEEMLPDESDRENYVIPEGDRYFKLFEDQNASLAMSEIRFLENKSLIPRTPMFMQYEGIGFDMNLVRQDNSDDDEYRDEANETLKRIVRMYPGHNRRI